MKNTDPSLPGHSGYNSHNTLLPLQGQKGAYENVYGCIMMIDDAYWGVFLLHCSASASRLWDQRTFHLQKNKHIHWLSNHCRWSLGYDCHMRVREAAHQRLNNLNFAKQWSYWWNLTIEVCMLHFFVSSKAGIAGTDAQLLPYIYEGCAKPQLHKHDLLGLWDLGMCCCLQPTYAMGGWPALFCGRTFASRSCKEGCHAKSQRFDTKTTQVWKWQIWHNWKKATLRSVNVIHTA